MRGTAMFVGAVALDSFAVLLATIQTFNPLNDQAHDQSVGIIASKVFFDS